MISKVLSGMSAIFKIKIREWIYLIIGVIIILLLSGIISGCCTVLKTDFSNDSVKKATIYYYLPESIIKIKATAKVAVFYKAKDSTLTDASKILEESFVVTSELIADTKNLLSLYYKPNPLASDDLKCSVNSKGLLESVNISTEDRTANIIAQLLQAPQVILSKSEVSGFTRGPKQIMRTKEFSVDIVLKTYEVPDIVRWKIFIPNELGINELPKSISADFKIISELKNSVPVLSDLLTRFDPHKTKRGEKIPFTEINCIMTRPIRNVILKFESATSGKTFSANSYTNIVIADLNNLILIPVKRTAFVKRINNVSFQDGIIIKNEINNPSSVEGFITIPINIAKAIVSIPGQLIQFRYDNTKRLDSLEKVKLDYEKSIQASQNYNLTKEQEFEKMKLELQKGLLEVETKRLETQKTLDSLKKEIEKIKQQE